MGSDRAIGPLIEHLRTTKVGGREGVNKRSKEWRIELMEKEREIWDETMIVG